MDKCITAAKLAVMHLSTASALDGNQPGGLALRSLPTTHPIPGGAYRHSIISLTIRSEGARFSGTHWPHIVGTLASGY